jgi:hypothetical protein
VRDCEDGGEDRGITDGWASIARRRSYGTGEMSRVPGGGSRTLLARDGLAGDGLAGGGLAGGAAP